MDDKDIAKLIDWWEGESDDPVKRNAYWKALGLARKEFNIIFEGKLLQPDSDVFKQWLLDTYGIEMHYQGTNISGQFKVVDEQKYTIFLLKHGAK